MNIKRKKDELASKYAETMNALRNKLKHAFKQNGESQILRGGEQSRKVFKSQNL